MLAISTFSAVAEAIWRKSSKYSLALYELIQKRGNLTKSFEDLSIVDLRNFLGVPPGKLSSWINLKNKAIVPAVKEVSDLSEFVVSIEPMKGKTRLFTDVRLSWKPKGMTEMQLVERELNHSKVGRKARLAGRVEEVHFGENALPSLRGDTIQRAKALLPGYDIYHVESEWRAWARSKAAPGNADAAFIAFCKAYAQRHPL